MRYNVTFLAVFSLRTQTYFRLVRQPEIGLVPSGIRFSRCSHGVKPIWVNRIVLAFVTIATQIQSYKNQEIIGFL